MEKTKKYALFVFVLAVVMTAIIAIYSVITGRLVEKSALNSINELAAHDRNTVIMFVEFNWKNLGRIGEHLKHHARELKNVRDINEYLGNEALESTFDKVYLLMEDGSYYTDITYCHNAARADYHPYMHLFASGNYKVVGIDSLSAMGTENMIIYGYELRGSTANITIGEEQKRVFAVIGITKRSSITNGLIIESYIDKFGNVRGYSSVVNSDGTFIVDKENIANYHADNWFEFIDECGSSELASSQVKEQMAAGRTFWFYQKHDGVREINYCIPLSKNIGWYLVLSVNDIALTEQIDPFVLMIAAALAIAVLVIVISMIAILVTERKRTQAYAMERAQSDFLSNMSHEIRTPLNGLIGLNHLMTAAISTPEKIEQIKVWLSKSQDTAKYLLSLINDVLDFSKLRDGKITVENEPMMIESIMNAIDSMQTENIRSRGIEFRKDFNITVPCVFGDEVHIKQVLMNIVGNAAKFTPAGGYIKLSVTQNALDSRHVLTTFVCEDSGVGMSREFLAKIFDKFSQDKNNVLSSTKGTGLGMAISKLLMNAMGGDITVDSEQGRGSTFTVTLPSEIADKSEYLTAKERTAPDQLSAVPEADWKQRKILVAEDNELNAEILMEILTSEGFNAEHAANGEQAVKLFAASEEGEFGVILMDMRMPVLDGCEATKQIRSLDRSDAKTVHIFACTANSFEEDKIAAYDSGMNDFLSKPIDVSILLEKMERVINKQPSSNTETEKE
ncbi:MAG: ATP-binding protein [Bacteroides sp.]|nr:ATP-binding protein [Prevotella sp.]MCM1407210.1 ATP-binding protein [Treponema brennaborense]MCM1470362.1 ATP-binding protein [Bacteroides sp.]